MRDVRDRTGRRWSHGGDVGFAGVASGNYTALVGWRISLTRVVRVVGWIGHPVRADHPGRALWGSSFVQSYRRADNGIRSLFR